jgi:hypothetical protein
MAEGDASVYNHFKEQILVGGINCSSDTFNMVLLDSNYSLDVDGTVGLPDVNCREITATGYNAGGCTLASLSVTQRDTGDDVKWDADDLTWASLGADIIRHAVIYDDTDTGPTPDILAIHFEIATNSNGGNYQLQFGSSGILVLS